MLMKYRYLFSILLCLFIGAQAQTSRIPVSLEDAQFDLLYKRQLLPKITGKLLNVSANELNKYKIIYSLVTPFASKQVEKIALVKNDGSFTLDIEYPFPYQQIWFSIGEIFYAELIIHKGLHIELDMKKILAQKEVNFNGAGVRYAGSDGSLTTYFNNYVLFKRSQQLELSKQISEILYPKVRSTNIPLAEYHKVYENIWQISKDYIAQNPSPHSWLLENELLSEYYSDILPMYWNKAISDSLWSKIKEHKSYLVSNSGAGFYKNLSIYIQYIPAGRVDASWKDLDGQIDLEIYEKLVLDSIKTYSKLNPEERKFPFIDENNLKWNNSLLPRIRDVLNKKMLSRTIHRFDSLFVSAKADFLKIQLYDKKDLKELKYCVEYTSKSMHTGWSKKVAHEEYVKIANRLKEVEYALLKSTKINDSIIRFGKPILQTSFGAKLYQVKNMKVVDFLREIRLAFSGKAILLDLWATWCSPCIAEMPYSKNLQQSTKDLPIEFIYLCTTSGSDLEKWKTKVTELQQPGIHFFIDELLDTEIRNLFSFSGYPGYALIDKDGKPGAIERPSSMDRQRISQLIK